MHWHRQMQNDNGAVNALKLTFGSPTQSNVAYITLWISVSGRAMIV